MYGRTGIGMSQSFVWEFRTDLYGVRNGLQYLCRVEPSLKIHRLEDVDATSSSTNTGKISTETSDGRENQRLEVVSEFLSEFSEHQTNERPSKREKPKKTRKQKIGDAEYRSRYLSHAKRALFHLSYTP